jgi:iron complex transport system ATP-binding protein
MKGAVASLAAVTVRAGSATILEGVSASFSAGAVTALIGPNGAGKSTLLRVMDGSQPVASGQVFRWGEAIEPGLSASSLRKIFLSQDHRLEAAFRVEEVAALGRWEETDGGQLSAWVEGALRRVELWERRDQGYLSLSGGERQRVHLARILVQAAGRPGPLLFLLDEPLNHLDPAQVRLVVGILRELRAEGHALVVVLHDLRVVDRIADRVIALKDGRISHDETPREVLRPGALTELFGTLFVADREGSTGELDLGERG